MQLSRQADVESVIPKGHHFRRRQNHQKHFNERTVPDSFRQKRYYDIFKNYITIINDHLDKTRRSDISLSINILITREKSNIFPSIDVWHTISFW